MACSLETHVAKLRKRSRTLLAQLEENSWKVNQELKKLCLQTPLKKNSSEHPPRLSEFWQLRNDSSGVGGILCQDYYSFKSPVVPNSLSNMTMQRRLLLSSKKKEEVKFRKPEKECYCNRQTRKKQLRSTRTKLKPSPCNHHKSLIDLRPMAWVESNDFQPRLTAPFSCETLRRVQNINSSPNSEFLQNKIASTQCLSDEKDHSRFLSYRPQSKIRPSVCRNHQSENEFDDKFNNPVEKTSYSKKNCASKEFLINPKKAPRETLAKKTLSSKKTFTSENNKSQKTKSNHFTSEGRTRSSHSSNKHPSHETLYNEDYFEENDAIPKYLKHAREFLGRTNKDKLINDDIRNQMANLFKFREQNYFDTHGSSQTLLSSGSSGSLEKFVLNERLFPQPAGKIHRGDLVVSMPECVTTENKRVHYFPRYVVRQEKNQANSVKKKHTCPLTGHAIDVRTLKIHHPSNSLALRFQKGVP